MKGTTGRQERWFLVLNIEAPTLGATAFLKNWQRLLEHDVAKHLLCRVLGEAKPGRAF